MKGLTEMFIVGLVEQKKMTTGMHANHSIMTLPSQNVDMLYCTSFIQKKSHLGRTDVYGTKTTSYSLTWIYENSEVV